MTERVCRHCHQPYSSRSGRGLCRRCWNIVEIKALYGPVAAFGGSEAAKIQHARTEAPPTATTPG